MEVQMNEGARAIEHIAIEAADSSDELDIPPDPRTLLAGGHDQHADRLGPETRKYEAVRGAEKSRGTGHDLAAGLRRGWQSFYTIIKQIIGTFSNMWRKFVEQGR